MNDYEHGLGRLPSEPDERDDNYRGEVLLGSTPVIVPPKRPYQKWYADAWTGDQGRTNMCTVYSLNHILADGPFTHRPYWSAEPVVPLHPTYKAAQCRDPWGCRASDDGTTMRAIAEEGRARGVIGNYWWFRRLEDIADYVQTRGVIWAGTAWTGGMFKPDADGFISVTGSNAGGHAYKIDEVHRKQGYFGIKNSWGKGWAKGGRARIRFADVEKLLADRGEFLAVTEQRK